MDKYRGDRFGNNSDSHPYRHSRGPPRFSDGPMNQHHRRSPNNYRGGVGGGHQHRPFDSPPRYPSGGPPSGPPPVAATGGGGGVGFRSWGGGGFNSEHQIPLSGQKRGYPFAGQGRSPDHFDGGNFAKLFVGSVPRTATEEDVRPLFEEHGNVLEVVLIKDKRTGLQQGPFRG